MGQVIAKYREDGYPDKYKQKRTGQTLKDESAHCDRLDIFWEKVPVAEVGPAKCDKYHEWRINKFGIRMGTGNRIVDRELNTTTLKQAGNDPTYQHYKETDH